MGKNGRMDLPRGRDAVQIAEGQSLEGLVFSGSTYALGTAYASAEHTLGATEEAIYINRATVQRVNLALETMTLLTLIIKPVGAAVKIAYQSGDTAGGAGKGYTTIPDGGAHKTFLSGRITSDVAASAAAICYVLGNGAVIEYELIYI